ncbi:MAG: response regulator [Leptospiraceae bacterium]|nr:response regulator [Leptospiraceae bacterium]
MMDEKESAAVILAVDDTPTNLVILEKALKKPKYQTVAARSGKEALEKLVTTKPDLILLDIMMPVLDGFQVCREIKKLQDFASVPVIFLTAMEDKKYLKEAYAAGGVDFIQKPFHISELEARVNTHLEIHRLRDHLKCEVERRTKQLSEALVRLEGANVEILNRMSLASEFRDNETGNHLKRMSRYSVAIGRAAGLPADELLLLESASRLHDVGKIGIPDSILLKPGKLTDDEFSVMKKHPEIGFQLLAGLDSELTRVAADIALTHHEKFDGTGYPRALKGDAIPLVGRIVAIADVFDALTTPRPYKKAWTQADATAFIKGASGTHFDPSLVSCFLQSIDEIYAVATELSN